ncbi:SRPBCC domain-containing protein [Thalassobius sp. Cn5-15]|jgi:hypothetical protein|uniref:SRPBCC domain-containing protein n=1 Tax=Thalassobius sp. Cn5-15 TaxID=2917763 RepID=UPI001EF323A2|nr:SRPBCC domain-containing protein [Thalassobius sp. Cn5-15]MCG7494525.1 SRPBCC domain-containing protein [Thalassobius sp. Cn5-15]
MEIARQTAKIEKVALGHRRIYTDILIDATPAQVWAVLSDFDSYPDWAAFMVGVHGRMQHGATLRLQFQLNPKKQRFNEIAHKIEVEEGSHFRWAERGPMGICDNHLFQIGLAGPSCTRFIQSDEISKGLSWLLGGKLSQIYLAGYQAFNRSLKAEVEARVAQKHVSA